VKEGGIRVRFFLIAKLMPGSPKIKEIITRARDHFPNKLKTRAMRDREKKKKEKGRRQRSGTQARG